MKKKTLFYVSYSLLLLITFIDNMGTSMIVPILPRYSKHYGSTTFEHGVTFSSYSIAQFISLSVMGWLSDKFGRKPLLLASLVGSTFGPIFQGFCWSTWSFIAGRFITGALGGSSTIGYAWIADCIPLKQRPRYQTVMSSMISLAWCIGPVFASVLIEVNLSFPLFMAGGLGGIVLILSIFFLKEGAEFTELLKNEEMELESVSLSEIKLEQSSTANQIDPLDHPISVEDKEQFDISKIVGKDKTIQSPSSPLESSSSTSLLQKQNQQNQQQQQVVDIKTMVDLPPLPLSSQQQEVIMNEEEMNERESHISVLSTSMVGSTAVVYSEVVRETANTNDNINNNNNNNNRIVEENEKSNNNDNNNNGENDQLKDSKFLIENFYPIFIMLLLICFLSTFHINSFDVIYPLDGTDNFGLSSLELGFLYMGVAAIFASFQLYFFDLSRRYMNIITLYYIAVPSMTIAWIMCAFAKVVWLSILGTLLHAFGGSLCASLHTVITSLLCKPEYGGKFLGYIMSAEGLARIVAPLLLPVLYDVWNPLGYLVTIGVGVFEMFIIFIFTYITRNIKMLRRIRKQAKKM